ncbi:MAG: hypothetical protein NTZ95_06420, partial [Candidatus Omnitrophica bacterium]|nr:hypothetical protein [Candidatus Omnitrophota bacterium]
TGQLGNAAETPVQSNTPVQVHGGEKGGSFLAGIASISAGATHNLATASDGYVYSWGENRFGQLGNGSTTNGLVPVKVHGANNVGYVTGVTMVAAGGAQTMMLTQVQYVLSMGYNATGQLGNGTRLSTNSGISVLAGAQSGSSASITPVVIESGGTLTGNASSFDYSQDLYHTTVYVAGGTGANYYDLKFTDNAVATYTLNSNISVFGDITISGAKLSAGSSSITLYGDWISSNGGIFTPGSGTVTLSNATLAQSVTSGGNSFNVIAIANTHAGDVTFVDTLKTNELQATGGVNGVKKIWFSAALIGAPNTINTHFDVNGVPGYKIELAPIALNTPWFLDAPSGTTMNYIKVGYSQQASVRGSITALNSDNLGGNNAYWNISS